MLRQAFKVTISMKQGHGIFDVCTHHNRVCINLIFIHLALSGPTKKARIAPGLFALI